jgi:predicted GNAT family acetyltransferase
MLNIVKANGTRVNAPAPKRYNWVMISSKNRELWRPTMDKNSLNVIHNEAAHRFEIQVDGQIAELTYILQDGTITFTHTGVPGELEGNGLGSMLVQAGLKYAWDRDLKVKATCWFVNGYIERHPESVK